MSRVSFFVKGLLIVLLVVVNITLFSNYTFSTAPSGPPSGPPPLPISDQATPTSIPDETEVNHMENVIQGRFNSRSARVKEVCSQPNHPVTTIKKPYDIVAVPMLGLTWCPTFKAGSSNWLDLICKETFNHEAYRECNMHRLRATNPAARFLSKQGPFKWSAASERELGLPFMVVRNPINRYLSAYRDKFEMGNIAWYYDRLGEGIVSKYRVVAGDDEGLKKNQLAAAREVILGAGGGNVELWDDDNPYLAPPGPTFHEFVQWSLDDGKDPHLITIYKQCGPCTIDYNILRLEKLSEEADYLFQKVERSYLNLDFQTSLNVRGKTRDCVDVFYSSVPFKTVKKAYNKFMKVDCELYSYPCEDTMALLQTLSHTNPQKTHTCK